jgi:hypothetical protein
MATSSSTHKDKRHDSKGRFLRSLKNPVPVKMDPGASLGLHPRIIKPHISE